MWGMCVGREAGSQDEVMILLPPSFECCDFTSWPVFEKVSDSDHMKFGTTVGAIEAA